MSSTAGKTLCILSYKSMLTLTFYCNGGIIRKCIGSPSCLALLVHFGCFAYFSWGMLNVYIYMQQVRPNWNCNIRISPYSATSFKDKIQKKHTQNKHIQKFLTDHYKMVNALSSDLMMCSIVVGRSSQILKPRQYNPYIDLIKENHKASALAKFDAFISNILWGIIPQILTHLGVLRFTKCRFCMPFTDSLSFA